MRGIADIAALLQSRADFRRLLGLVESLALPDCWIGAGLVRNAVWDALHGRTPDPADLNDVDVIFFDPSDIRKDREIALEQRLRNLDPKPDWSVRNQARMHVRNGDRAYRDTSDAMVHWAETSAAVAARLAGGRVEVIAPLGVDDLIGLIVRPTPVFYDKMDVYRERLTKKNWTERWPRLTIVDEQ